MNGSSILCCRNKPAIIHNIMSTLNNSVRLTGHLGSAPEIKITESQKKLAKISIATNSYRKNAQGERVTETTWHQVVLWENQAELAEKYLAKGSKVAIEGRLANRFYTDRDGIKRYTTEVIVNEIDILTKN
jgi:single-strand DNA-binding protein